MADCDINPCIREYGGVQTLMVKGRPFMMLAGEVHNSASSSLSYMEKNVWPYLRSLHLNTLFVPVTWALTERRKGNYDMSLVKGLLEQARQENMHLVLLWFGLWKNGESDYVPEWMKVDTQTYFRAENEKLDKVNCISPFCEEAIRADAAAFAELLRFLREHDATQQTVLMLQVENETGLLGACRDFCGEAEAAFCKSIPPALEAYAGRTGTWSEVFKEEAGECMMAWKFASAVEHIAQAGKKEYPLPMYTNAWLEQYPWRPGGYPSGGPVTRMFGIWKLAAPSLAGIEPDIYLPDMKRIMEEYSRTDNPLLIPEARRDVMTVSYAIYSMTAMHAIGYAPFGIEDIGRAATEAVKEDASLYGLSGETLKALQISTSAYDPTGTAAYLSAAYRLLQQLAEPYFKRRNTPSLQCFIQEDASQGEWLRFKAFDFLVTYEERRASAPIPCGGIIELEPDTFLLYGCLCSFRIMPKLAETAAAEIIFLEEGEWLEEGWQPGRVMNGDEKQCCRLGDRPAMVRMRAYKY